MLGGEFPHICREFEMMCLGESKDGETKSLRFLEGYLQFVKLVGIIVLVSPGDRGHAIWVEQPNFEGGEWLVRMGMSH